jgi:hypothetical protein
LHATIFNRKAIIVLELESFPELDTKNKHSRYISGAGAYVMISGLYLERPVLVAHPIGLMQDCLHVTASYVCQRVQFGHPADKFTSMQV